MPDANRLAQKWVSFVLRSEMLKYGVTYADLATRLADMGLAEECGALRNRVSRGRFSGAFLFQCLSVIGTKHVNVELYDYIRDAGPNVKDGVLRRNGARRVHTSRTASGKFLKSGRLIGPVHRP